MKGKRLGKPRRYLYSFFHEWYLDYLCKNEGIVSDRGLAMLGGESASERINHSCGLTPRYLYKA